MAKNENTVKKTMYYSDVLGYAGMGLVVGSMLLPKDIAVWLGVFLIFAGVMLA
jgi:hypothetical protein